MPTCTCTSTYVPGLGLLMTLKGGEFGVGLLPLLEEVDSTPLVLLCPVLVGLFPCWRALYGKMGSGVNHISMREILDGRGYTRYRVFLFALD